MPSRSAAALVGALMLGGALFADETRGIITKVGDGSITVQTGRRSGKNAEKTFEVAKDAKITRPALDRKTPEVKLTLDELKTAVKVTTVIVTVTHEGGKVSEIKVGSGGFGGE
jgi:hypothetical protein